MEKTISKRKQIDWDAIERDWRAGLKTKQQMAAEYSVSRAAMNKRFGKIGVSRDLSARIQAEAEAKLREAEVTQAKVTQEVTLEERVTEKEIVEVNATAIVQVITNQRGDIKRFRALSLKMMNELEFVTDNQELFEQLGELLIDTTPNENGKTDQEQAKRLQALNRALDLSSRVDNLKKLSEVLKVLIALERESFGMGAGMKPTEEKPSGTEEAVNSWQQTMDEIRERIKAASAKSN